MKEQALVLRENAKQQLMEIKTIDEAVTYINKVKAIETYCKAVKEDNEIVKIVAEQKIRSMRLAGQILKDTELNEGVRGQLKGRDSSGSHKELPPEDEKPTLSELGISKNESSTYQKIATIPEDKFEDEMNIAKNEDSTKDITVSRFKNFQNKMKRTTQIKSEKQLKKYAKILGMKLAYLKPDLVVCYKLNSDLKNIKQLYN